jgi:hypothetical protein
VTASAPLLYHITFEKPRGNSQQGRLVPSAKSVLQQLATASQRTGRRTIIKIHPNEDLESEREHIQKIIPNAIVIGRETAIDELFSVTGVLVNRATHKPVSMQSCAAYQPLFPPAD